MEALAVIDGWTPDLILLDLNMPQMDGWTFRAHQLALDRIAQVPVVVLSATADLASAARTLAPAATLRKPFEMEDILRIVRSVLPTETLQTDVPA
jgi:CheY-like chemotaxis protein